MKQRKIIGRIVHFFLPFSTSLLVLNAIHILPIRLLVLVGAVMSSIWLNISYHWEYKWQGYIARKLPILKWDSKPDVMAFLLVIIGSIIGSIIFFII